MKGSSEMGGALVLFCFYSFDCSWKNKQKMTKTDAERLAEG